MALAPCRLSAPGQAAATTAAECGALAVPEDRAAALEFAREHPDAEEVRIVAGVTRHGAAYCALRLRSEDDDMAVMGGPDLVPALLELLHETLRDDQQGEPDDLDELDEPGDPAEPRSGKP